MYAYVHIKIEHINHILFNQNIILRKKTIENGAISELKNLKVLTQKHQKTKLQKIPHISCEDLRRNIRIKIRCNLRYRKANKQPAYYKNANIKKTIISYKLY